MATKSTPNTGAASLDAAARLNNKEVAHKEQQARTLAEHYKGEKKVVVMGAPMYRAYFGNSMPIGLCGIMIYVPLDGNRYEIPESYAQVFNARINSVNEEIELQRRRSDVAKNAEAFPGELNLISPV
jgi:hypothetical protein